MPATDIQTNKKTTQRLQPPKKWKVIFVNDDYTPMTVVVDILSQVFNHNEVRATEIMLQVHETGSAVAGIYSFEIAEAKAVEATRMAREHPYPLLIKLEEEK